MDRATYTAETDSSVPSVFGVERNWAFFRSSFLDRGMVEAFYIVTKRCGPQTLRDLNFRWAVSLIWAQKLY